MLPNSLFTHLESYTKMNEFHPTIMQKINNRNFFSVCVFNPQKLFPTDTTSTESVSLFWKLFCLHCWTLQKFSLHTDMADYLRLKHMYFAYIIIILY